MSSIIKRFHIFRDFPTNTLQSIKCFYISENKFGFCVLNDNKVYGFGENVYKFLGKSKENNDLVLIEDLKDTNIEEFFEGNNCMFAITDKKHIYSWGTNDHGQLCRGISSGFQLPKHMPQKIDFFDNKEIIYIICGQNNCLFISSDCMVYELSGNKKTFITHSYLKNTKIQFILNTYKSCDSLKFITFDETICQLNKNMTNEEKICDLNVLYNKISPQNKIIDFCYDNSCDKLIFQTETNFFTQKIAQKGLITSNPQKCLHKTLFEYFLLEKQMTYKTIHIKDNQLFAQNIGKENENSKHLSHISAKIQSNDNYIDLNQKKRLSLKSVSNDFSQIIESDIKCYYQSGTNSDDYFEFVVMNDNKVYSVGNKCEGKLGFGNIKHLDENKLIKKLCNKNIEEFYEGLNYMFAKSDTNIIYSWGNNKYGQLGLGFKKENNISMIPQKVPFFDGKKIIFVSCGDNHCLGLSSDGLVFEWGYNLHRYIEEEEDECILTPHNINFENKVKFIHCTKNLSFVVDINGLAYYWGNSEGVCEYDPKLINVETNVINVSKVCYYFRLNLIIILGINGKVYKYNPLKNEFNVIELKDKITDLYEEDNYCLFQTDKCVYKLKDQNNLEETNFLNFYDFYSKQLFKKIRKTIHFSKYGFLMTKDIILRRSRLIIESNNIFNNKFENIFKTIGKLGEGGYGVVFKVKKKPRDDEYAIKKVELFGDIDLKEDLKEIKIMSKLNSEKVVQYIDSWIEGNETQYRKYLYIQMELCLENLSFIIESMQKLNQDTFKIINYFISYQLFKELIECVDYLHSKEIIHRDLKPKNVLISFGNNCRVLKLCDFGVSKIHEMSFHTRKVGTAPYTAPEVEGHTSYNMKSDIYSLALITTEIFQFNKNVKKIRGLKDLKAFSHRSKNAINYKFNKLLEILEICLYSDNYNRRPDSRQLLESITQLSIDKSIVKNDANLLRFRETLKDKGLQLLEQIFERKLDDSWSNNVTIEHTINMNEVNGNSQQNNEFDKWLINSYYEKTFDERVKVGEGSYGTVWKAINKMTQEEFAIKEIKINDKTRVREINIFENWINDNNSHNFIVKYIKTWTQHKKERYDINLYLYTVNS